MDKEAYDRYLQSDHWLSLRVEILKRFGYRCALCGVMQCDIRAELNVHHNNYSNLGNEEVYDLVVLCADCHCKVHTWDESKER